MLSRLYALGALVAASAATAEADHYAVLVAGSHGYGNYRHHADVCHAYHIVREWGIKEDNIIVMMYDDVANYIENPYPGQLFNKPTAKGQRGVDVYAGCKKDYRGSNVTAEKFMAVLTGDKQTAGGPVLQSGPNDHVFINFVDHGGVGLIAFPNQPYLYAKDLMKTLETMHEQKMYKELVFYMEACESGSMWEKLPSGMNIYATTAANAKESSWGTYCPPNDIVDGKAISSCLGDLYSVNWMQDADRHNTKETLEQQFQRVKKLTNKSHCQEFGDVDSISGEPVNDFIGNGGSQLGAAPDALQDIEIDFSSDVDSRDHELHRFYYKYLRSGREADKALLLAEMKDRDAHDARFSRIAKAVLGEEDGARALTEYSSPESTECHKAANEAYGTFCGGYSDYALKYVRVVVNMCEMLGGDAEKIVYAIENEC